MKHSNDRDIEIAGICGLDEYYLESNLGSEYTFCISCNLSDDYDPL